MIGQLLGGPGRRIGVENPGYVDANNIFSATGAELVALTVDNNGLVPSEKLSSCDVVYTTPSHQCPTSVTLSLSRRLRLVEQARQDDLILIEDDYEHELNFLGQQHAAIKSYDNSGRIIYVGSLTKLVFPGVRIGFVLADAELIQEMRALRRLVYRHPSAQNQRAMAIFIAEGHLDAHIRRTRDRLSAKWHILQREIARQMPDVHVTATTGGSALWLGLPGGIDTWAVHREGARRGVLIEPGDVHYMGPDAPTNRMRLGFAAVAEDKIAAGIALLAEAIEAVRQSAPRPE
jgi:GntR family transcriptional regulator / MocR family aminotransferase